MAGNSDNDATRIVQPARKNSSSGKSGAEVDDTAATQIISGGVTRPTPSSGSSAPEATRIIGVSEDTSTQDAYFTTGWLVIVDGPGKGISYPLRYANNTIGRGSDQVVCLNQGDSTISSEHAVIIFDDRNSVFHLVREAAKNNIYLNDELVIESKSLKKGDKISLGETTVLFVPLCDKNFKWND